MPTITAYLSAKLNRFWKNSKATIPLQKPHVGLFFDAKAYMYISYFKF